MVSAHPELHDIAYSLGLLLAEKKQYAEAALLKALELDPDQMDYLRAAADFYLKRKRLPEAKRIAEHMIRKHPANAIGPKIIEFIHRNADS